MLKIFRVVTLDEKGEAVVELPAYFEALNKDFRYQVKPINKSSPSLYIKSEIKDNQFMIAGGEPKIRVSWQVTGVRHDPYIRANPIIPETRKGRNEIVNRGEYLFPELAGKYIETQISLWEKMVFFFNSLFK
ncbi:MAG: hypothetical protein HYT93_00125 [Parcubacteria group bacterium]|nr:hypothetical protein [Parcubacteria group bacterium]